MAFGTGPFGVQAFGLPAPGDNVLVPVSVVTSQKIDGKSMDYVVYNNGNHAGMSDTQHRMLLFIAFNVKRPALIGKGFEADMLNQIRKAWSPLLKSSPPTITIFELTVETEGDSSYIYCKFKDNASGITSSFKDKF